MDLLPDTYATTGCSCCGVVADSVVAVFDRGTGASFRLCLKQCLKEALVVAATRSLDLFRSSPT